MTTKTIDLLTLTTLDEHPRVHEAQLRVADARRHEHELQEQHAAAVNALRAEQRTAASGPRDDKRLRQRDDAVRTLKSELQIAEMGIAHAEQLAETAYAETAAEIEAALRERRDAAARAMDRALQDARRASFELTRIEDASGRLFIGGVYRRRPGRPLPRIAWEREFGGPGAPTHADTRFEMWRKHCGVTFDA